MLHTLWLVLHPNYAITYATKYATKYAIKLVTYCQALTKIVYCTIRAFWFTGICDCCFWQSATPGNLGMSVNLIIGKVKGIILIQQSYIKNANGRMDRTNIEQKNKHKKEFVLTSSIHWQETCDVMSLWKNKLFYFWNLW